MGKGTKGGSQDCESQIGAKKGDPDYGGNSADGLVTEDNSQATADKAFRDAKSGSHD